MEQGEPGVGELLSLTEAAAFLGVTNAAVSQMLGQGRLAGPAFPGRAPKGAGRVTPGSAQSVRDSRRARATRRAAVRAGPEAAPQEKDAVAAVRGDLRALKARFQALERDLRRSQLDGEAAKAGLLRAKIAADQALDAARQERNQGRALNQEVGRLSRLVTEAQDQTDRVDAIARGHSETLTQLLIPGDPSTIGASPAS